MEDDEEVSQSAQGKPTPRSAEDRNEEEENYDEFDLLAQMNERSLGSSRMRQASIGNATGYIRSFSENTAVTSGTGEKVSATWTTTGSACSHATSEDDSTSLRQKHAQKVLFAAKHRRNIHGRRNRDYTSITDELELMIAASPPLELQNVADVNAPKSPAPPPAILIETECLHDAEEADYELMETIIHQRLRRDSTNLQVRICI